MPSSASAVPPFEWLDLPGAQVRIRRTGTARGLTGPPLLLTNAWPQTIRCWDRQWAALAETHELVAVDLPGFLVSPAERKLMRPSAQAAVVASLIERLELDRPVYVGPDVGVPIGLALAQQHPGAVRGLVLFDGPGSFPLQYAWDGALLVRSAAARKLMSPLGVVFVLETIRRGYSNRDRRPRREAVREYLRAALSPRRFGRSLDFLGSYADELPQIRDALGNVEVPVLLPWGSEDPFVPPVNGEAIAAGLPHATWAPFGGVSHYAHEDAGQDFLDLLERWIETEVAPARPVAA